MPHRRMTGTIGSMPARVITTGITATRKPRARL